MPNRAVICRIFLIAILSLVISGCKTIVCWDVKRAKIAPVIQCSLSLELNACVCNCMDFNEWETLDPSKCPGYMGRVRPIESCDGLWGVKRPIVATELRPKVKRLIDIRKQYCEE